MPDQQFKDLERAQDETVRALGLLSRELRQSRGVGELPVLSRVLVPARPTQADPDESSGGARVSGQQGAFKVGGIVPPLSVSRPVDLQVAGNVGAQNVLGQTTRALRSLTQSVTRNTDVLGETSKSIVDGIRGVFSSLVGFRPQGGGGLGVFGGGLGLASVGLKIAGLFRGDKEDPVRFTPFDLPPGINLEVANPGNILAEFPRVVRGQDEQVRAVQTQPAPAQVVVNISAMDSQSFLDRSSDIARAVRDAMLHMHPLNDVVSEM